jgi:hypothetical protein
MDVHGLINKKWACFNGNNHLCLTNMFIHQYVVYIFVIHVFCTETLKNVSK